MSRPLDKSTTRLRKIREQVNTPANWGVVPSGSPLVFPGPRTESFKGTKTFAESEMSTPDQLPGPQRMVGRGAAGGYSIDFLPGTTVCEEGIEEMLCDEETTVSIAASTAIEFIASDNSINGAPLSVLLPGMWVSVLGSAVAGNNTDGASGRPWAAYVASKPTSTKAILAFHTVANEAAGEAITIAGRIVRNGTDFISSAFEREHVDASSKPFQAYTGAVCARGMIDINERGIIGQTNDYICKGVEDRSATSIFDGEADIAAPATEDVTVDASNNVTLLYVNNVSTVNLKSFTLDHVNNAAAITTAMTQYNVGVSLGTKSLTGTLSGLLYDNDARETLAENTTAFPLHLFIVPDDATAPVVILTLFRIKLQEFGDTPKDAKEGPYVNSYTWRAEKDTDIGYWCQVAYRDRS